MQAFGPYAGRETIDFREAVETGLFGIYGQTGSGKSSIFSAMTFALFGQAAKSEQEASSLRSDHADAGLITEVELVFDVGSKRYVVVRRPEQSRPKKRGEGETKTQHEAFLFDATGRALDDLKDGSYGPVIAEKKVRTVDDAVTDLLGYGSEQFRQIVLLPQGRFETFLAAKTKERLGILRDLFDVSVYRNFTAKLKADAEEIERKVQREREVCAGRLASVGFESTDALLEGIQFAGQQYQERETIETDARTAHTAAQKALQTAQTLEQKFAAAETAQEALAKLNECNTEMQALAKQVERAGRAKTLLDPEQSKAAAAKEVEQATEKLNSAKTTLDKANKKSEAAERAHKFEEDRAGEIDDLSGQIRDLAQFKVTLEKARGQAKAVATAESNAKAAKSNWQAAARQLEGHQSEYQTKDDALKSARKTEAKRIEISGKLSELNLALRSAETYAKATAAVQAASTAVARLDSDYKRAAANEKAAQVELQSAEQKLAVVQALHLASRLQDGEPCPVCGGTEHPAPATGSIEHAGLDGAFREAKEVCETAKQESQKIKAKLDRERGALGVKEARLKEQKRPNIESELLRKNYMEKNEALNKLGPATDVNFAEKELEELGQNVKDLTNERDQLQQQFNERQNDHSRETVRLEEMLSSVPNELRDGNALTKAINTKQLDLKRRLKAFDDAIKAASEAAKEAVAASRDLEAAKETLTSSNGRRQNAIQSFNARLAEVALSVEEFEALKQAIKTMGDDHETVDEYNKRLLIAENRSNDTAEAIDGLERPNLKALEVNQSETDRILTGASGDKATAKSRLDSLNALKDELAQTLQNLDEEEKASGPLRSIAALANGDNFQKLDLETFAIGAMFDQVLEAANLRLGPMTANRYRLERDLEGSGRGRRGLGIQAFDQFTGKTRPTSSLSGGETFIAALALALGLADVVESSSGKVRLDTIFIDEGFGSLDTENGSGTLDQVLNVLNNLVSQNRAVGLISHVPLVQEAIPNGFYVRKHLTGSSIETRAPM